MAPGWITGTVTQGLGGAAAQQGNARHMCFFLGGGCHKMLFKWAGWYYWVYGLALSFQEWSTLLHCSSTGSGEKHCW